MGSQQDFFSKYLLIVSIISLALFLSGCSKPSGTGGGPVSIEGKLTLLVEGKEETIPLETMDVFLTGDESKFPETFIMNGKGVSLVGAFPEGVSVGYEEDWTKIIGKSITIDARGNPGGEGETDSRVTLQSGEVKVEDGTFIAEKVLGHNPNGAGSVLDGKITLYIKGKPVEGRFRVLAKTWG